MKFEDLKSPDLQAKLQACESAEELVELARENGVELGDEELDEIAGGGVWNRPKNCPKCGSTSIYNYGARFYCRACRHEWDSGGW